MRILKIREKGTRREAGREGRGGVELSAFVTVEMGRRRGWEGRKKTEKTGQREEKEDTRIPHFSWYEGQLLVKSQLDLCDYSLNLSDLANNMHFTTRECLSSQLGELEPRLFLLAFTIYIFMDRSKTMF